MKRTFFLCMMLVIAFMLGGCSKKGPMLGKASRHDKVQAVQDKAENLVDLLPIMEENEDAEQPSLVIAMR